MHIKELGIHNVYKDGETSRIKFDTPLTILTGYNGCGKTTILEIIHSSLSMISQQPYEFAKTNWGSELVLADDTMIYHAKIARPIKETFRPASIKLPKPTPIALEKYYNKIFNETRDPDTQSDTIVVKDGQGRPHLSTNIISINRNEEKQRVTLSSTLYCDELFNSKEQEYESQKLEELDIFSKNKNLDKTLLLLLKEFSAQTSARNATSRFHSEWTDFIMKLDTASTKEISEFQKRIESLRLEVSKGGTTDIFLDEANRFFKDTHRTLIINERNLLALQTRRGEVQWYDFSKGEKTLLCLLLVAHLNRNNEKVFLLDEPDLSLHINWQKLLLNSLQKLAPQAQFIVATHSPALVGRCKNEKIINIALLSKA